LPQEGSVFDQQPSAAPQSVYVTPHPVSTPVSSPDDNVIGTYYGKDLVEQLRTQSARNAYCILEDKELDNEEFITLLEQLPAHNRKREDLKKIRGGY
jgi:hypothetical protein